MIVMMICHYDDSNPSGGLEKQSKLLSTALRQVGQDVVILASTRKFSRAGWSVEDDVPIRYFWTYASPQVSGRYFPAALIWAVQLLAWVFVRRSRIDLVHGHQLRIHAFVTAIASKFFKIPSILKPGTGGAGADIRAIGTRKYLGAIGRSFVVRNTSCFVATTSSIRDDLVSFKVPLEKIRLIPNGIALPEEVAGASPDIRAKRCIFLGRLDTDKNISALARAVARVSGGRQITLHIYGAGPKQSELEAMFEELPDPGIKYCGWTAEPGAILGQYGFLLLPSEAEGLSNAMIEAMAHGVVPVATRVSGCVDHIVPGRTGFFFEGTAVEDLESGLNAIAAVSTEEWSRLSKAVSRYAAEHFDIEEVCKAYLALYADLSPVR